MSTFKKCTTEELINGLHDLEDRRSAWAALPTPPKPDYVNIEAWLVDKVANVQPPQLQSYPDTWRDLRSTSSWSTNIPLVAILASSAVVAAVAVAVAI